MSTKNNDKQTTVPDMSNVIILEIQHLLGVFYNGSRVRSQEKLDWLGHAIFAQKGARLATVNTRFTRC